MVWEIHMAHNSKHGPKFEGPDADMTVAQVMKRLNISRSTAYALMEEGVLRYYKVGRHRRFTHEAVNAVRFPEIAAE